MVTRLSVEEVDEPTRPTRPISVLLDVKALCEPKPSTRLPTRRAPRVQDRRERMGFMVRRMRGTQRGLQ